MRNEATTGCNGHENSRVLLVVAVRVPVDLHLDFSAYDPNVLLGSHHFFAPDFFLSQCAEHAVHFQFELHVEHAVQKNQEGLLGDDSARHFYVSAPLSQSFEESELPVPTPAATSCYSSAYVLSTLHLRHHGRTGM